MNKFLTKPIIYANEIATYIDFANIDCDKNKFYCIISKLESFPKKICTIRAISLCFLLLKDENQKLSLLI